MGMARVDHYRGADAPAANSIVVAVTAVVVDGDGRVLLIRRSDSGLYAVPGGALELGETLTGAVRREVMEETGIAVEVRGLVGVYSDPEHVIEFSDGEVRQEFSVCFRAVPVGGDLRTSEESSEVLWVAPDALAGLDIHPSIRLRIEHGLDGRRSAPYYS
jgi:ADP-ribose pyrophosphatase YjhB (NUDIX family)